MIRTPKTRRGWLLVAAGAVVIVGIAWAVFASLGSTSGFDDASPAARDYARTTCELQAVYTGRPASGSWFDACLDREAVQRDAR